MLKKYLSDIAFMQVINLLVKPIWILLIDSQVQEFLPDGVYGNYFGIVQFSLSFFIILDLGLNGFNTTQVSRDTSMISSLSGNIIGVKILLSVVYLILAFSVGSFLGYTSSEFFLLIWITMIQITTSFNQYLRTLVSSLQRFKWDGIFMVLDRVMMIVICSILIWGGIDGLELTIQRFAMAQLFSLLLVTVSLVFFLHSYLKEIRITFKLDKILPLLDKAKPFALLVALMGMYTYFDGVMLKYLAGDVSAGTYAMGYRLFYSILMFAQIFSGVLLPLFSKNLKETVLVHTIANYTLKLLLIVGFSAAFVSYAYSTEIIQMLYPSKSSDAASQSFSILMFSFLGSALFIIYGTLLTAARELKSLNIFAGITLVVNLVLNLKLIPVYGASGAATATLISQLLFGGLCYLICHFKFKFKVNFRAYTIQFLGIALLGVLCVFGRQYIEETFVHLLMIFITVVLVAYLFDMFKLKQLKSFISK